MSRASCQHSEGSGCNIGAMIVELLSKRARNGENNMLRSSNYRVTVAVIFQPSLSISLRLRGPFIQFPSGYEDHSCAGRTADALLPGDWQADLEHHSTDNLHTGPGSIIFPFLITWMITFVTVLTVRYDFSHSPLCNFMTWFAWRDERMNSVRFGLCCWKFFILWDDTVSLFLTELFHKLFWLVNMTHLK